MISGGFCKDQVYLEGVLQLLKHRKQIDFHLLTQLGKVSWEDMDKIGLLANLSETKVPFFMEDLAVYHKHLDRICEANGLTDELFRGVTFWVISDPTLNFAARTLSDLLDVSIKSPLVLLSSAFLHIIWLFGPFNSVGIN